MTASQLDSLEKALRKLPIVDKELTRLKRELPSSLKYHSVIHTEDVIRECLLFGLHDALNARELELLVVAAVFHDSGFLVKTFANESYGADFAAMAMEEANSYSKQEVSLVSRMIMDTEILWTGGSPQFKTHTALSGYLLDADLSNFGREDFFEKSKLFAEETNQNVAQLRPDLITFLRCHNWHTQAAKDLRQEQKLKNLRQLETMS